MEILIILLLLFIAIGTMVNTIYLKRIAKKLDVPDITRFYDK